MSKTLNELLEDFGQPSEPCPPEPPWHIDSYDCHYGWIIGGTEWGVCDCEDPANPWPPRVPGDGPKDCCCYGCNGHKPRWERGKLKACEYKDHHCDDCHEHRRCTVLECGFNEAAGSSSQSESHH